MKYLIEDLLPSGQVHLIGGPSGAGKTRLMFQMYAALNQGKPFLGRRTRSVKWAYISGDRPERSVRETMEDVGVDFRVFSLVDKDLVGRDLLNFVLPQLTKFYSYKPDFIYIDGFSAMPPEGKFNDYLNVAAWLAKLQRYCVSHNITILGACHTTKTKEGEKFLNPRQRIAGSIAWAGFSETVILLDPIEEKGHENQRLLYLLPRNRQAEYIYMAFNDEGLLEPIIAPSVDEHAGPESADLAIPRLFTFTPGSKIDYKACMEVVMKAGFSRSTWDRWVARQVEDNFLEHPKKGIYVVRLTHANAEGRSTEPLESETEPDHHKEGEKIYPETLERGTDAQIPEETREA